MAAIDPYSGPWTRREAWHLIRRTCFGAMPSQIDGVVQNGLSKTLDTLFAERAAPPPPVNPTTGTTYVTGALDQAINTGQYNQWTKAWWAEQLLLDGISIREKLTLFWMNHFATEFTVVQQPQYSYGLLNYLRMNGQKSFKDMARQVTIEPAMLRYLNGSTNTVGNANENYARELQELFTIGKGPEIAKGNYTTYTEDDVRAAAKVLTGWVDNRQTGKVTFDIRRHDKTDKQFSEDYGNVVIKGRTDANAGLTELNELLDMIFAQNATSHFIVRKLYHFFVNSDITPDVETSVIVPLAAMLRSNNWMIGPVLRTLLASEHFYSADVHGAVLKSPADFLIGLLRSVNTYAIPADLPTRATFFKSITDYMMALQMDIGEPPNVAGWEAYYQTPDYYKLWLTTVTLPLRNGATDSLVLGQRGKQGAINTVELVKQFKTPSDAHALVDECIDRFLTVDLTAEKRLSLIEDVLVPGGKDYDWTALWTTYMATPTDKTVSALVKLRLDSFFKFFFRMAEYQLV
jgi:hypothetical protein